MKCTYCTLYIWLSLICSLLHLSGSTLPPSDLTWGNGTLSHWAPVMVPVVRYTIWSHCQGNTVDGIFHCTLEGACPNPHHLTSCANKEKSLTSSENSTADCLKMWFMVESMFSLLKDLWFNVERGGRVVPSFITAFKFTKRVTRSLAIRLCDTHSDLCKLFR